MIGIKELAETLGISIGTVSRAVNNKPDVSPKTRALVLAAAKKYGYVANQSGQSLRKGSTRAIGLVLPLQAEKANAENALSIVRLTADVQTMLSPAGYDLFLLPCPNEETPHDFLMRVLARRIADGFIIMGFDLTDEQVQVLDTACVPLVSAGVTPLPDSGFSIGQQMLSHIASISPAETPGKSGKKKQSL